MYPALLAIDYILTLQFSLRLVIILMSIACVDRRALHRPPCPLAYICVSALEFANYIQPLHCYCTDIYADATLTYTASVFIAWFTFSSLPQILLDGPPSLFGHFTSWGPSVFGVPSKVLLSLLWFPNDLPLLWDRGFKSTSRVFPWL